MMGKVIQRVIQRGIFFCLVFVESKSGKALYAPDKLCQPRSRNPSRVLGTWDTGSPDLSCISVHNQNLESTGHQAWAEHFMSLGIALGSLATPWKSRLIHWTNIYHAPTMFQALLVDGMNTNINIPLVHNLKVLISGIYPQRFQEPQTKMDTWFYIDQNPPKFPEECEIFSPQNSGLNKWVLASCLLMKLWLKKFKVMFDLLLFLV